MRSCIYPGSFDPPTNGHIHIVERCVELFDETIILVGWNPAKKSYFSIEDRLAMWEKIARDDKSWKPKQVQICWFSNQYAVDWAQANNVKWLVRGIRGTADLEYETAMQAINSNIQSTVKTLFIVPPPEISCVSSSAVRGMVGIPGWEQAVSKYVPKCVIDAFKFEKGNQ